MANHRQGNVIFVDTTAATFVEARNICAVKYIGNTNGTLQIQDADSGGAVLWKESGSSNIFNGELEIRAKDGVYVALTNGASAFIYLK